MLFQESKMSLSNYKCIFVLSFFISMVSFTVLPQSTSKDSLFNNRLNILLENRYNRFSSIDSMLYKFKRDTIKMKQLVLKSRKISYLEGECYALNMLGTFYRNKSYFDKAIENHLKAKKIAINAKNKHLHIVSLNMLGVVYRRKDAVKFALDYHQQALTIADGIKNPSDGIKKSIAVSQNSLGNIYLALEQYELAIHQFQKSLDIEKRVDSKLGMAINYHNIGYAKEALGLLDEALVNYETSLDYNNLINSKVGKVICNNSIGQIYIKKGNINKAYKIIKSTIKAAEDIGDKLYIASTFTNLGWVQTELKQYSKAEQNLLYALNVAKKYNLKSEEADAYKHLSNLNEKTANYSIALQQHKKSEEISGSIANTKNTQYITDIILKYDAEKKSNQIKALASENEIVKLKLKQNEKTFWFLFIGLLLLMGIFLGFYKQRQLKKDKHILTLEQDMLRAQMNPHFIFNSLNSIKLYIINNEKENAVYYLNKFSKLIRKILVASTEKEISLEDELETMQLYMNIENIRFNNEINYNVSVDDNVNTCNIKVPSLVLQPFLENALWHGLSSKEGKKNIYLNVSKEDQNYVKIDIIDNGIGRKKAAEIQKNKLLKRKSVGIKLTKQRLANFSKDYSGSYTIVIEDVYKNNSLDGTKVSINIPIKEFKLRTA